MLHPITQNSTKQPTLCSTFSMKYVTSHSDQGKENPWTTPEHATWARQPYTPAATACATHLVLGFTAKTLAPVHDVFNGREFPKTLQELDETALEVAAGREAAVVAIAPSSRGPGGLLRWEITSSVCAKGHSHIDTAVGVDEFYGSNLVGTRLVLPLAGCGLCGHIQALHPGDRWAILQHAESRFRFDGVNRGITNSCGRNCSVAARLR